MKELRILDVIATPHAIIRSFGAALAEVVAYHLTAGEAVTLSFEGLKGVNHSFLDASIGKLYALFGKEQIAANLAYTHLTHPVWQSILDQVVLLATNPDMAKAHDDALEYTLSL